jgi:hypothetical protein
MRVLQLGKHGGRANQQQHQPHRRGRQSLGGLAHAGQQALHRACALLAHEVLQLGLDLTSGGVFTRHQPGDRHHDQQQRRQWKQDVKGQRCAHARHIVVQPGSRRLFDQAPACCKQVGVCHGVQMSPVVERRQVIRAAQVPLDSGKPDVILRWSYKRLSVLSSRWASFCAAPWVSPALTSTACPECCWLSDWSRSAHAGFGDRSHQ